MSELLEKKGQMSFENLNVTFSGHPRALLVHYIRVETSKTTGRRHELYQRQAIGGSLTLRQVADFSIVFGVFQRNTKCAHKTQALAQEHNGTIDPLTADKDGNNSRSNKQL